MDLYIIRHGQSVANADNQLAGWLDAPLTDKGYEDARKAGEKIKNIRFEKIYASDLSRASCTCETAMNGAEYEKTTLLRELSVGEFEGMFYDERTPQDVRDCFEESVKTRDFSATGGESHQMQLDRVGAFMNMVADNHKGNVAAFTHAGTLECFLHLVLGFKVDPDTLCIPNCVICVLQWNGERWKLKHWNM
jgi:broad specificity phosphatase PhoE